MRTPLLDRAIKYWIGDALLWLGKRAADRRDWHEVNHLLVALSGGDHDHDPTTCGLPTTRGLRAGETWTVTVPGEREAR